MDIEVVVPTCNGYYSAIKRNKFESVEVRWMNLEPVIESENQIASIFLTPKPEYS